MASCLDLHGSQENKSGNESKAQTLINQHDREDTCTETANREYALVTFLNGQLKPQLEFWTFLCFYNIGCTLIHNNILISFTYTVMVTIPPALSREGLNRHRVWTSSEAAVSMSASHGGKLEKFLEA